MRRLLISLVATFAMMTQTVFADSPEYLAFIGTYTRGKSEGIYVADYAQGKLSNIRLAIKAAEPSFLVLHPNGRILFAVNELGEYKGKASGAVSAYSIDSKTGQLTLLNQQPSCGAHPCHIVVDRSGKHVLVANYSGGNLAVLPIDEKGRLSPATQVVQHVGSSILPRQSCPHAHSINLDKENQFAVAADLGLDQLLTYRFDRQKGTLTANDPPSFKTVPGAGPRHFAFSPFGRHAYLINEINSTINVFDYDPNKGVFHSKQIISTLPDDYDQKSSTAEIVISPDGRFVFGSNRGHDSIVAFRRNDSDGTLKLIEFEPTGGKTPRNFVVDPEGRYLLAENQNSDTIVSFEIDSTNGSLRQTGKAEVPSPVCIKFLKIQD